MTLNKFEIGQWKGGDIKQGKEYYLDVLNHSFKKKTATQGCSSRSCWHIAGYVKGPRFNFSKDV